MLLLDIHNVHGRRISTSNKPEDSDMSELP